MLRQSCFAIATCAAFLLAARGANAEPSTTTIPQGYEMGEIQSPRSVGMGGALNATGVSTNGLFLNPANMPLARVYHLEALGAFSPEARRQSYGAAAVDSVLNRGHLAGGIAGVWSAMDPDGIHRTWTDIRGGLGYPLGDHLSIGATGRYLRVEQATAAGPLGASYASDGTAGKPLFNQITFDLGATLSFTEALRLGIVGHNLTNPGTALAPTTLAGGFGYMSRDFAVEADGLADFTSYNRTQGRFMVGAEVFLADHYAVRAGYRYDTGLRTHAATFGLGYVDRKWSIEVSGRRDVVADHPSTMFALGLRYFYDAVGPVAGDEPDAF
jgi:opacity protein-like surface antigen